MWKMVKMEDRKPELTLWKWSVWSLLSGSITYFILKKFYCLLKSMSSPLKSFAQMDSKTFSEEGIGSAYQLMSV
jgi:hypothetical protein